MDTLFDLGFLIGYVSMALFLPLQVYAAIRCRGVWRIVALLPILLLFPFIAFIDYVFPQQSNLFGLVVLLLTAPVGTGYLIILLVIRRRVSHNIQSAPSNTTNAGELPPPSRLE